MKDIVIVGSGFSALISYFFLKKFDTQVISSNNLINNLDNFKCRKNLEINKYFSNKLKSKGNFEYFKKKSFEIHDRLSFGGNTNIWGGFINIEGLSKNIIKIFKENHIKFENLDQIKNGYKSNINTIRQLRDEKNNILDSSRLIKNILPGLVHSFNIKKNYISIKYFDFKNLKYSFLETKKLLIAISFPQLIDLLFRSGLLIDTANLILDDFEHDFKLTFSSDLKNNNKSDYILKYDFLRASKHYLGYQNSIDSFFIKIPIYIDQTFYNKKIKGKLKIDVENKKIIEENSTLNKFGSSIHYCNLKIDNLGINEYISNISKNIVGVSMPFVKQSRPGPISNDIIANFSEKIL